MKQAVLNQWTIVESQDTHLLIWIEAFLIDRKSLGLSNGTIQFYQSNLGKLIAFCEAQEIRHAIQILPSPIREYLLHLDNIGHNQGGIHACYRVLKTFLLWWEEEIEPEGWKNPIRKVKAPKLSIEPLKPVKINTIQSLLKTCNGSLLGKRDRALILFL